MTARSGHPSAEGDRRGTLRHIPVLLPEVLGALAPQAGEPSLTAPSAPAATRPPF